MPYWFVAKFSTYLFSPAVSLFSGFFSERNTLFVNCLLLSAGNADSRAEYSAILWRECISSCLSPKRLMIISLFHGIYVCCWLLAATKWYIYILIQIKHFLCLYVLLMCMYIHFLETKYYSNINEVAALSIFEFLKENVIHYNIWKCNTQCNIFQIS